MKGINRRIISLIPILLLLLLLLCFGCDGKKVYTAEELLNTTSENDWTNGALVIIESEEHDTRLIPLLTNRLKKAKTIAGKCNLLVAITKFGKDANDAIPAIILLLNDEDKDVVSNAIEAIGQIQSFPNISVPALMKAGEKWHKLRWLVARSLGEFGKDAVEAIPLLRSYQNDSDINLSNISRNALNAITGNGYMEFKDDKPLIFIPANKVPNRNIKMLVIAFSRDTIGNTIIDKILFDSKPFDSIKKFKEYIAMQAYSGEVNILISRTDHHSENIFPEIVWFLLNNNISLFEKSKESDEYEYIQYIKKL